MEEPDPKSNAALSHSGQSADACQACSPRHPHLMSASPVGGRICVAIVLGWLLFLAVAIFMILKFKGLR